MLPIIICDDQIEHRNYIKELVEKYILIEELDMKIMLSVGNPQAVIQYVSQSAPPFLYFLDVDLKDDSCSGITLAQKSVCLIPEASLYLSPLMANFPT